jgi:BlaI family transcriptional regulator, penicillinase repressor
VSEAIPTERELQALKILWQAGEATVRQVCDAMGERGESLAYTTVLSLLQVMEQKELVGHTAVGKTYTYYPKVQRDSTFRSLAKGFLNTVFDGAMEEYLMHALQAQKLSPRELDRLGQMIAQARQQSRSRKNKGVEP